MGLKNKLDAVDPSNSYRENLKDAYFKVVNVLIDAEKKRVRIQVRGWLSEYSRRNNGIGIYKKMFFAPLQNFFTQILDGSNITKEDFIIYSDSTESVGNILIERAYNYLKTDSQFSDAVDMLGEYDGPIDIVEEKVEKQSRKIDDLMKKFKKDVEKK